MNTTTNKAAKISKLITDKVAAGMSIREAFDAVLGAGAYMKLAGEVYDTLRARNI